MTTIVIEIPHQSKPQSWIAYDDEHLFDIACELHGLVYNEYSLDSAIKTYGGKESIPVDLLKAINAHGLVVEVGDNGHVEYMGSSEATDKASAARSAISSDLHSCYFLTVDEARDFSASHSGHQAVKARAAVKDCLNYII